MSQHDYTIDNQSFPAFRTDLNNVLGAINSTNSGSSRPSSAVAGTIWLDTSGAATAQLLKMYDGAADILLGTVNFTANTIDWSDSAITLGANSVDSDNYVDGSIDTAHIADGQVTLAKLAADSVNATKIADNAISEEHLDVTAITGHTAETSIADDDTILIHDTSSSALRKMTKANFISGIGGTNTPAFQARLSDEPSVATSTFTKVPFNVEVYDVGGCYDNSSNYRFTPTTAGKYVFYLQVGFNALADGKYLYAAVRKNGSTIFSDGNAINHTGHAGGLASRYTITAEANGSSDYFEGWGFHNHGSNRDFTAGWSFFGAYKIIE